MQCSKSTGQSAGDYRSLIRDICQEKLAVISANVFLSSRLFSLCSQLSSRSATIMCFFLILRKVKCLFFLRYVRANVCVCLSWCADLRVKSRVKMSAAV